MNRTPADGYASPPCFAHELETMQDGIAAVDPVQKRDVARWRKAERARLIDLRLGVSAAERARVAVAVGAELDRIVDHGPDTVISLYWPFRGELDLRGWMERACTQGSRAALPVVVAEGQALAFREWRPDCRWERGVWNIPNPVGTEEVVPDILIAPVVGYDRRLFRLGHGGGFFDRTLAALPSRPIFIGVGHPVAAIATIYPQPHDIPMDMVLTGAGDMPKEEG
mgnify:CR=1 FL=1